MQANKICDNHLTCKVENKCLNVRERVEVVEWNKMVPSLPLLSCELSVSVKKNPDRKKKKYVRQILFFNLQSWTKYLQQGKEIE